MKKTIVMIALLCASAAFAQTPAQPRMAAGPGLASINNGLIACLRIPDGTKGRLGCFDAVIAPLSKTSPTSRDVASCRYYTEQDQRLSCFNDFAESIPRYSSH
jgi:hypothetical protein